MRLDVVMLPSMLTEEQIIARTVAVFDVLRATTTMTAALAAGVAEIRLFGSIEEARSAAQQHDDQKVLVGEVNCLPPEGFDLGNSPGAFERNRHEGQTLFMCTTNGTRALLAAARADEVIAAALVNASAVARHLAAVGRDITLLCAGTNGQPALEALLGAGAVIDRLMAVGRVDLESDIARMALAAWRGCRGDIRTALRDAQGGRNVIAAGLEADIDFAARLDALEDVGRLRQGMTPVLVRVKDAR